ncbi:MAG TPA: hypothetical protein VEL03_11600 [Streptosporangiaceae bacterium]|nr:hypothetical protein [Streptosporangiaceae bacterium]
MTDGQGTDEGMDAREAAGIMQDARKHAEHELQFSHPVMLAGWGVIYILAYGWLWLSVRGQRPYQGPTGGAAGGVTILVLVGLTITAAIVARASAGVGGLSSLQRRIYWLSLAVGFAGIYTLEAAIDHAGASRAVIAVIAASGPVFVAGVVYVAGTAVFRNWAVCGLGCWLVATAAGSAFAGPVAIWAVNGLAGGLGFLTAAAVSARRGRA